MLILLLLSFHSFIFFFFYSLIRSMFEPAFFLQIFLLLMLIVSNLSLNFLRMLSFIQCFPNLQFSPFHSTTIFLSPPPSLYNSIFIHSLIYACFLHFSFIYFTFCLISFLFFLLTYLTPPFLSS